MTSLCETQRGRVGPLLLLVTLATGLLVCTCVCLFELFSRFTFAKCTIDCSLSSLFCLSSSSFFPHLSNILISEEGLFFPLHPTRLTLLISLSWPLEVSSSTHFFLLPPFNSSLPFFTPLLFTPFSIQQSLS